jgi:hypothetical protein
MAGRQEFLFQFRRGDISLALSLLTMMYDNDCSPRTHSIQASEGPASKEGLSLKWDAVKAILNIN